MESIAMPMQTLVAGAEMMSTGICNNPIPPSMHIGTRLRLKIIAAATRKLRPTISAITEKNAMSENKPLTRLDGHQFRQLPLQFINTPDEHNAEPVASRDCPQVVYYVHAILFPFLFDHSQVERRPGTIFRDECARDPIVFRLIENVQQVIPAEEESKRMMVGLIHQNRQ